MVKAELVPLSRVEGAILVLRGHRVMLDEDLATLYEVDVRALNQAVKRNMERFPADFAFRLTTDEARSLRSQTVILDAGQRGRHRKYPPTAFTEQGVAMLSSVLRSRRAVPRLTDDHVHERVQASQIVGIARNDHRAQSPRQERNTGVDHIGSPAPTAQNTDRLGFVAIQHLHVEQTRPEQTRETRLPRPVTPHLRNDTGRDVKRAAMRHGQLDQRANLAVVALEGDESPRVHNYRPSTARAHASSFAVAGPLSAFISASRVVRSSRRAFSSIAESTQALTDLARPCFTCRSALARTSRRTVTVTRAFCIRTSYFGDGVGPQGSPSAPGPPPVAERGTGGR